ncbi:MAG: PadR family transcriptional regulator [Candidatus Eremiobacteraeota bacterium]|nr:PadR family transcriptional regulator [Candidatus Eremiobacteraeota bacterium]
MFHFWNPEHDDWARWAGFPSQHFRRAHRGRLKRGLMRLLVLKMLLEGARHGYDFMRELRRRGWAQASPGSVYPTLQWLEEHGFVESREENGKRVYVITPTGEEHLKAQGENFFHNFFDGFDRNDGDEAEAVPDAADVVRAEGKRFFAAVAQAARAADEATTAKVVDIIKRARKEIYTLLANE